METTQKTNNIKLTEQETCDILNGLNLLIATNDSQPGHYNNTVEWKRLIALSNRIYRQCLSSPGNNIFECNICDGRHQYNNTEPVPYDQGDYFMCQACHDSQEG